MRDPGFYLPNDSLLVKFFPESFIISVYKYETEISPIPILFIIIGYLVIIGIFYHLFNNMVNLNIKFVHIFITVFLITLFFFILIEDEMIHELIDADMIDNNVFSKRYKVFILLLLFWVLIQVVTPLIFLIDFLRKRKKYLPS